MRKGRKEPRKDKIERVEKLANDLLSYPVIGILSLHGTPASALQRIRFSILDHAIIKVEKKSIIERALKKIGKEKLIELLSDQPAVIMVKEEPFKFFKRIKKSKSKVPAKPGDVAQCDIVVPAGPTDLPPGPAISTLQKVKIAAKVEGGKIAIVKDCLVAKKGEKISEDLASALSLLKIKPIEVGLNVLGLMEDSMLYTKDVLDVNEAEIFKSIEQAVANAFNLSVNICYPTRETIEMLLLKGYVEAKMLGLEARIIDKGIIEELLKKAKTEAELLASQVKTEG